MLYGCNALKNIVQYFYVYEVITIILRTNIKSFTITVNNRLKNILSLKEGNLWGKQNQLIVL